jgi:hypothetical protein
MRPDPRKGFGRDQFFVHGLRFVGKFGTFGNISLNRQHGLGRYGKWAARRQMDLAAHPWRRVEPTGCRMRRRICSRKRCRILALGCLLICTLTTSCRPFLAPEDSDPFDGDTERPRLEDMQSVEVPTEPAAVSGRARKGDAPTVKDLAHDLDLLERHIEKCGSVVAQHPDVWGQARLTKHRQDFEDQMAKELGTFSLTLQGSLARSDQAYAADALSLSNAAAAASSGGSGGGGASGKKSGGGGGSSTAMVVTTGDVKPDGSSGTGTTTITSPSGTTTVDSAKFVKPAGNDSLSSTLSSKRKSSAGGKGAGGATGSDSGSSGDGSSSGGSDKSGKGGDSGSGGGGSGDVNTGDVTAGGTFGAFGQITRTSTSAVTGPPYPFLGASGINVEPEVYLNQKARYLGHLNELRRINEGDDTADSPGYALNLVRIPVSILPGKCTEIGHGAEVTMTLTPRLSDELLPTTFRNLILNDLVDQLAYPITEFINNPQNSVYLDDSRSSGSSGDLHSDVADLFHFVDDDLQGLFSASAATAASPNENDLDKLALLQKEAAAHQEVVRKLQSLRWRLTLQPLFLTPEWNWVNDVLKTEAEFPKDPSQQRVLPMPRQLLGSAPSPGGTMPGVSGPIYAPGATDIAAIVGNYGREMNDLKTKLGKQKGKVYQSTAFSLHSSALISATKSRRATLPFPPTQMVEVYGYDFTYQMAVNAYRGLSKERFAFACPDAGQVYIHLPDIQGYLQEELAGVYKLLSTPYTCDLWHLYCTDNLANAVRSHQTDQVRAMRNSFKDALTARTRAGSSTGNPQEHIIALAWATIVESALLNQQLIQDMKESAAAKGCPPPREGWMPYFHPDPPPEARQAFNDYVRCRWPIHVFALDPVTQQQNISDTFSGRREMQLSMSLAFVGGKISANNLMRYARRIEYDMATIDLNNTQVGFSHGDDTFGWRFYPRYQTPDIQSNATVFFRDLLIGGPSRNALLRQRRLEPGERECVAIVIMPSFVPYADLNVTSNWFKLTNPKAKTMDTEFAMRLSKSVKCIENCGLNVYDAGCYRDGDLDRLRYKAKQLAERLPLQSTVVQIPYENTLGGFGMFNTGVTDLAPELTGWYGSPSINPNKVTSLFLVGNHFSVHQTNVIAGGNDLGTPQLLSRQVMKVDIPPSPNLIGNGGQKFVDIHLATPYGLSQHLLVPVCIAPCPQTCGQVTAGVAQGARTANTPPPPTVVSPTSSAVAVPLPSAAATQTQAAASGAQTSATSDPNGATWKSQSGGGASGKNTKDASNDGGP